VPYPQNPATPGAVNGHYLFEAAAIIHRVIRSDRSLKGEQVDALSSIACGALQLFLADADVSSPQSETVYKENFLAQ
jgi:hypothetical protein